MVHRIVTPYKLLQSRVVESIGRLKFLLKLYSISQGGARFSRMVFDVGQTVGFLIFNTDRKEFVLVSQIRFAMLDRNVAPRFLQLEIAAGMVDPGEDPTDTLIRKCRDETGYVVARDNIRLIGHFDTSPGFLTERMTIYYVEVSNKDKKATGGGKASEIEKIEVIHLSPDKVSDLKYGESKITDLKTCFAIQWWILHCKVAKMLD